MSGLAALAAVLGSTGVVADSAAAGPAGVAGIVVPVSSGFALVAQTPRRPEPPGPSPPATKPSVSEPRPKAGPAARSSVPPRPGPALAEPKVPPAPPAPASGAPPANATRGADGPANPPAASVPPADEPKRVRIGDENGRTVVAQVYGGPTSRVVMLPDGELGWPNAMVYTNDPFRPQTADELRVALLEGPYRGFHVRQSAHYLIFYQSSTAFARDSEALLDSLYSGLFKWFDDKGLEPRPAQFPLVAVIFRTERDFRAHRPVAPDIQAYYEIVSNRIFFYETKDQALEDPQVASRRKPQTVAHEGTHQILQNIGVQPRLAPWPMWLVEGLAEFCAPTITRRDAGWAGMNKINPFHMATLRDLEDPMSLQLSDARVTRQRIGRDPRRSFVGDLVTRAQLSPTDYALSWALTYYLANQKFPEFVAFLKEMSGMSPLERGTPEKNLASFKKFFGPDLLKMDKRVYTYMSTRKNYEQLVYYAVTFEQPLGNGLMKLGTLVSQSPLIINQWLDEIASDRPGAPYYWHAMPFRSRASAFQATEQWLNSH